MGVKFGTEEGTFGPLLRAKFHPHRCNVSPLWGENPQNRPLSKLNNRHFALRAMLPVNKWQTKWWCSGTLHIRWSTKEVPAVCGSLPDTAAATTPVIYYTHIQPLKQPSTVLPGEAADQRSARKIMELAEVILVFYSIDVVHNAKPTCHICKGTHVAPTK